MTLSHKNMLFLSLKFPFLTDIEKEKFQKNKKISRKPPSHYFHGKKQGKQKICLLHQFYL